MQYKTNVVVGFSFVYAEVVFSCIKGGRTAFRDFLKSEFCEENLDFWLACQELKNIDRSKKLKQRAQRIYEEFIGDGSPRQVNLHVSSDPYCTSTKPTSI